MIFIMFRTDGIQESLSECADECKHNKTNVNDTAPLHHPTTSHKWSNQSHVLLHLVYVEPFVRVRVRVSV